jgi:hypothetical protein
VSSEIQVRRATEVDIPALADLYVQNHDFQRRGVPRRLKATSDSWKREGLPRAIARLLDRDDSAIFVAEANDEVIGLVDIFDRNEIEVEGRPGRRYESPEQANKRRRGQWSVG